MEFTLKLSRGMIIRPSRGIFPRRAENAPVYLPRGADLQLGQSPENYTNSDIRIQQKEGDRFHFAGMDNSSTDTMVESKSFTPARFISY
ncbi:MULTISPECIES: hypothetical protein [unclassified Streptomyces]|uniref:Uncharacterized protein n=1 Tax=Streptomyces sp. NBC_00060 TaxID=2975636 RepID=A0AAU2GUU9_9ACTN